MSRLSILVLSVLLVTAWASPAPQEDDVAEANQYPYDYEDAHYPPELKYYSDEDNSRVGFILKGILSLLTSIIGKIVPESPEPEPEVVPYPPPYPTYPPVPPYGQPRPPVSGGYYLPPPPPPPQKQRPRLRGPHLLKKLSPRGQFTPPPYVKDALNYPTRRPPRGQPPQYPQYTKFPFIPVPAPQA